MKKVTLTTEQATFCQEIVNLPGPNGHSGLSPEKLRPFIKLGDQLEEHDGGELQLEDAVYDVLVSRYRANLWAINPRVSSKYAEILDILDDPEEVTD